MAEDKSTGNRSHLIDSRSVINTGSKSDASTVGVVVDRVPGLEELVADDGQVVREAFAHGEDTTDTGRRTVAGTPEVEVDGVELIEIITELEGNVEASSAREGVET